MRTGQGTQPDPIYPPHRARTPASRFHTFLSATFSIHTRRCSSARPRAGPRAPRAALPSRPARPARTMAAPANYSLWLEPPPGVLRDKLVQEIGAQAAAAGAPGFEPHVTLVPDVQLPEEQVLATAAQLASSLQVRPARGGRRKQPWGSLRPLPCRSCCVPPAARPYHVPPDPQAPRPAAAHPSLHPVPPPSRCASTFWTSHAAHPSTNAFSSSQPRTRRWPAPTPRRAPRSACRRRSGRTCRTSRSCMQVGTLECHGGLGMALAWPPARVSGLTRPSPSSPRPQACRRLLPTPAGLLPPPPQSTPRPPFPP